jgi:APA family basic amino acid/polyamine antiporter
VKAPLYPWLPAAYVLLTALISVDLLVKKTTYSGLGLLIVALGVPVYFVWRSVVAGRSVTS